MEDVVSAWRDMRVLDEVSAYKLIFMETKDVVETTLALDAYKKACTVGRGAVFFSVRRGLCEAGLRNA
jgi:DNA excision repair protein ERCC-2